MLNASSCRAWAAPGLRFVLAGAAAWLLAGRAAPVVHAQPAPAAPASAPSPSLPGVPADLKRDEIRCAGEACAIGACLLQDLSRDPSRAMGSARIVPVAAQGQVRGFRLFGLRPGSLLAQLGISNGDLVIGLSGQPLNTPDRALAALGALRSADSVLLELEREGQPLARRVHFDRRPLRDDECPRLPSAPGSDSRAQPVSAKRPDPAPQETLRRIASDLRCQGDRCTLHRSTVDEILGHSQLFAQSARLIPVFKEGRAQGFKVLGLRPGSLLALLGLRNGDEVRDINGFDLSSPERALEAYVSLRSAAELRVGLLRSGAQLTRTYVIVP